MWRKSLQKLLPHTIFSLPGFTGTSFPALNAGCTDFLCTMIGSSNSSWQSIEAGQRNTIFPPFYFSSPVPYTGAQWCYEANPNPNPNPTMEELIHSEICSPFLRSFTKGNSIPSWQCFIRAAFNAYNIMQNRKLTVTKSNFFRQKVFAVIPDDLVIQHQRNILSLLWYEGNTENEGLLLYAHLGVKTLKLVISKLLSVLQKTNVLKCVPHVQLKIVQHVWHIRS